MKFLFFAFFAISAVLGSEDNNFTTDFSEPRDPRIVGGVDTNIEEVPYQVALRRYNQTAKIWSHFCGGSIIRKDVVLTAAHCTSHQDPELLEVRAGSPLRSQGGQIVKVKKILNHPDFQRWGLFNDVAILKLKQNLIFSQKIMSIGLPPKGFKIKEGTQLLVSGWGDLTYLGNSPERLQKVYVPYVPTDKCEKIYWFGTYDKICAGIVGKDACQGDSGGPLVYKNFIVGIVSGGYFCGYEGYPGTYARVSEQLQFILEAMAS